MVQYAVQQVVGQLALWSGWQHSNHGLATALHQLYTSLFQLNRRGTMATHLLAVSLGNLDVQG